MRGQSRLTYVNRDPLSQNGPFKPRIDPFENCTPSHPDLLHSKSPLTRGLYGTCNYSKEYPDMAWPAGGRGSTSRLAILSPQAWICPGLPHIGLLTPPPMHLTHTNSPLWLLKRTTSKLDRELDDSRYSNGGAIDRPASAILGLSWLICPEGSFIGCSPTISNCL
jgi:hypothetical protein